MSLLVLICLEVWISTLSEMARLERNVQEVTFTTKANS